MNDKNDQIARWVANKADTDFKGDISMVLTYGSYVNGTGNPMSDVDFYFIPRTDNGYKMSRTFIIGGIGYDLFPMSWARVEGLAEFNECITPCLADVKILYSHSEEEKARFLQLQNRLAAHLEDAGFMLGKAKDKLKDAINLYGAMLFEKGLCENRAAAGYIALFLSDAVAYANQTYFRRGLKKQMEDVQLMELPCDFLCLYDAIIRGRTNGELRDCCCRMIESTGRFLESKSAALCKKAVTPDYRALAEWYEEGISTFNKIHVCCETGDAALAFISGTCLQRSLNEMCDENGLRRFYLMDSFDAENLNQFNGRAEAIQRELVATIEAGGARIRAYGSVEEFISATP